jgi:hypothetical protein
LPDIGVRRQRISRAAAGYPKTQIEDTVESLDICRAGFVNFNQQ